MKSSAIFPFLFGILILFLNHGPSAASSSCQFYGGICFTQECGEGEVIILWDCGCKPNEHCCKPYGTTSKIRDFDYLPPHALLREQSFRDRFDGIKNSSHYKTEVFVLAQEIKDVTDAATDFRNVLRTLCILKSEFPETVRKIVWGDKVALFTKKYNEYFYAYHHYDSLTSQYGTQRRRPYTWRPGGDVAKEGFWKFESKDGKRFLIYNARFGECLYAQYSKFGKDLRDIFTWQHPCDVSTCFWQIEYMGDNEIKIINFQFPEYLATAGDSHALDEQRRRVFTGTLTLDDRIWKVVPK